MWPLDLFVLSCVFVCYCFLLCFVLFLCAFVMFSWSLVCWEQRQCLGQGASVAIRGYRGSIRAWRGGTPLSLSDHNITSLLDEYILMFIWELGQASLSHHRHEIEKELKAVLCSILPFYQTFCQKKRLVGCILSVSTKGGRRDRPLSLSEQT